nr:hypothetical protein CFP56_62136 [Quercus suber]
MGHDHANAPARQECGWDDGTMTGIQLRRLARHGPRVDMREDECADARRVYSSVNVKASAGVHVRIMQRAERMHARCGGLPSGHAFTRPLSQEGPRPRACPLMLLHSRTANLSAILSQRQSTVISHIPAAAHVFCMPCNSVPVLQPLVTWPGSARPKPATQLRVRRCRCSLVHPVRTAYHVPLEGSQSPIPPQKVSSRKTSFRGHIFILRWLIQQAYHISRIFALADRFSESLSKTQELYMLSLQQTSVHVSQQDKRPESQWRHSSGRRCAESDGALRCGSSRKCLHIECASELPQVAVDYFESTSRNVGLGLGLGPFTLEPLGHGPIRPNTGLYAVALTGAEGRYPLSVSVHNDSVDISAAATQRVSSIHAHDGSAPYYDSCRRKMEPFSTMQFVCKVLGRRMIVRRVAGTFTASSPCFSSMRHGAASRLTRTPSRC